MKKRVIVAGLLVLVLAGGAGLAWQEGVPQQLGWVKGDSRALTLYGNVDIRQVQLGFRVSGRLASLKLEEGDSVKAGDLLAVLDDKPYRDQVAAAEATVAASSATYAKLKAGPRAQEIGEAKADLAAKQAALRNARLSYDRISKLQPTAAASRSALDAARAERDQAEAEVAAAEQSLSLLEEGNRAEDIAVAAANLGEADAQLQSAHTALTDTELKAPADGIILSRVAEPGAILAAGSSVYVLSLTKPVWVRAYVGEPDLGRLQPGMKVTVASDSEKGRFYHGTVGFISPVAEFTPKAVETPELRSDLVYRLRIVVEDAGPALRQGMPVTVRLAADN
ncbi:secretion protein HlyD [Radicibacter daui]|uniref:secretion protein HlyD n=1 Tax=Radicibacter daui TaxID=3064829 RepID=UPI004046917C